MNDSDYKEILEKVKSGTISRKEAVSILTKLWEDKQNNPVLYAAPEWIEAEEIEPPINPDFPLKLIIFNYNHLSESIRQRISTNKKWEVISVSSGNKYQKKSDSSFTLDYQDAKQVSTFLQSISLLKDYKIIFICKQYEDVAENNIQIILDENIIPLFVLIQTCINLNSEYPINVSYVFSSVYNYLYAFYAGLSGFVSTLKQESTKVSCRIIETDNLEKNLNRILNEVFARDSDHLDIKIMDKRFVKSFREILSNEYNSGTISFKKNGVYLITGGTGGLGLIFSDFLAREYQAKLVLSGRSALNIDKKTKIKQIEDAGGEVLYVRGDITQIEDIKALVATSKKKFTHIDGIIHSAGIIKDAYIREKQIEDIYSVIMPKVTSVLFLDYILKNENLDFFILFSSIATLGNPGQSDYAYANSFMDNFSSIRNLFVKDKKRKGRTLSINWPFWEKGGMRVELSTIQLLEKTKGLRPLTNQNGINALIYALKTECNQFMVLPGNKKRIMRSLFNMKMDVQKKDNTKINDSIRKDLQNFIIRQIEKILDINTADIDVNMDLNEYGFDMIGFTELTDRINEKYSLAIVPTIFLEINTVLSFVQFLLSNYSDILLPKNRLYESNRPGIDNKSKGNYQSDILNYLKLFLIDTISSILKLDKQDIDINEDMSIYGFDSIGFTNLANSINSNYNLTLTPAIFYEYPSIQALMDFLQSRYKNELLIFFKKQNSDNDFQANDEVKDHQSDNISEIDESSGNTYRFFPDKPNRLFEKIDTKNEPIAIIGMAGIMPGAENLDVFWKNLVEEKDCIIEIPHDRWDWKDFWGDPAQEENKTNVKWGGFIKDIDKFDTEFFSISPREAMLMDPQHRLFLETVWNTIEDAGYRPSDLSGSLTGVFVGVQNMEYAQLLAKNNIPVEAYFSTGTSHAVLPNRISFYFNFNGPSEAIDAACASSLIAIHRAIQSIVSGDCQQAIVGGVNSLLSPDAFIALNKAGALSTEGRCKTFSKDANGYARAEGVGAVLLKPLSKALSDGDHIYAVIRGSAENHGGKAKSLTAPNPNSQAELIIKAMERAQIDPSTISYIEAHGTGTGLGDPIEINGLKKAYKKLYEIWGNTEYGEKTHCGISSVKTNIGHLETGAGIAGILKILLAMKYKTLPGTVHFSEINPYIELEASPFFILKDTIAWDHLKDKVENVIPYRAGISSFGFGGANAHIVLEEFIPEKSVIPTKDKNKYLIVLSAKSLISLKLYAMRLKEWLEKNNGIYNLNDIEYTLLFGREEFDIRLAMIINKEKELIDNLESFYNDRNNIDNFFMGIIKKDKSVPEKILNSKIGQEVIKKIIINRNLPEIAELWVSGLLIDWSLMYPGNIGKRISLPTYQFVKERFWLPVRETIRNEITSQNQNKIQSKYNNLRQGKNQVNELNNSMKNEDNSDAFHILVVEYIKEVFSEVLKNKKEYFDKDESYDKYGIDSLNTIEIVNRLKRDLGNLSATLLYKYTTIEKLAEYLLSDYSEQLCKIIYVQGHCSDQEIKSVNTISHKQLHEKNNKNIDHNKTPFNDAIAIIGVNGIFPGSKDLDEFWDNLVAGKDCITEIPKERWDWHEYYGEVQEGKNKTTIKWGGFIEDADKFDAQFFGISSSEAVLMDPQQRLFLQSVWKTIEDAGYRASDLYGEKIGIYVGINNSDYREIIINNKKSLNAFFLTGTAYNVVPNRISYFLNFHGPSEAIDTACSSSLIAVHRAVKALQDKDCQLAIAGGVNLILSPMGYIILSMTGMLSSDGRCHTFDKQANGYARGEGIGSILLKPLERAVSDNDNIYAVIKGTAENHGGKAKSFTAPNPTAQTQLIIDAYNKADIDPSTVTYIEAHGTGTSLGDPIEIEGLKDAFKQLYNTFGKRISGKPHCGLGSVKTNIGHLEPAAGIAGLIKILLCMKNKKLPKLVNLKEINPYIDIKNSPFYFLDKTIDWQRLLDDDNNIIPRRASVSSFGFGGANGHVVLEEYINKNSFQSVIKEKYLILISAKIPFSLKEYAINLSNFLERDENNHSMTDIEYTLIAGREEFKERAAFIVSSKIELVNALQDFYSERTDNPHTIYLAEKGNENEKDLPRRNGHSKYIDELISNKNLYELAVHWLQGHHIDWKFIYVDTRVRRIPLPTYFFQKRSYIMKIEKDKNEDLRKDSGYDSIKGNIVKNNLLDQLKEMFATEIHIPVTELDENASFSELGVESILQLSIFRKISEKIKIKIELDHLENLDTVAKLFEYINSRFSGDSHGKNSIDRFEKKDEKKLFNIYQAAFPDIYSQLNISIVKTQSENTFEVFEIGKGEPILLLPALACLVTNWALQIPYFYKKYKIIVIHYPGVGRSDNSLNIHSFESVSTHFFEILNSLHIQNKINIVGLSYGGYLAQYMAIMKPEKIKSLCLVNTGYRSVMENTIENAERMAIQMSDELKKALADLEEKKQKAIYDSYMYSSLSVKNAYSLEMMKFNSLDKLKNISIPTIIFTGKKDQFIPCEDSMLMHKRIKNSKYIIIENAGHAIPLSHTDLFNKTLFEFLSRSE